MSLKMPPGHFVLLSRLVTQFNEASEAADVVKQLYYLQKIHYEINKTTFDGPLYDWVNHKKPNGWKANLLAHGIHPYASFYLSSMQFAGALAKTMQVDDPLYEPEVSPAEGLDSLNELRLMQQRNRLFGTDDSDANLQNWVSLNLKLNYLAHHKAHISETITKHCDILERTADLIRYIKNDISPDENPADDTRFSMRNLGDEQTNNYNVIVKVQDLPDELVIRAEDRAALDVEQDAQASEAANYFIQDYGVFILEVMNDGDIEYKPVVLSQFANQGSLRNVAMKLGEEYATALAEGKDRSQKIATGAAQYFEQMSNFCTQLIGANLYHPDIKLSNFLVDRNRLRLSDRKTLTKNRTPKVRETRSSPAYAPEEYTRCISKTGMFNAQASIVTLDMPSYMSYQLGMALKEFLILTQRETLPDEFDDPDYDAASYFSNPPQNILNLSLLIHELTRSEPSHRLEIGAFQGLLRNLSSPTQTFLNMVESVKSSEQLGLQNDIQEISQLLTDNTIGNNELMEHSNAILTKISERNPSEPRLMLMGEQLATHCYARIYREHFKRSISIPLAAANWALAPWYRKVAYYLTAGFYKVDEIARVEDITPMLDVDSDRFRQIFPQLSFLPASVLVRDLGVAGADRLMKYVSELMPVMAGEESELDSESDERADLSGEMDSRPLLSTFRDEYDEYATAVRRRRPAEDSLANHPKIRLQMTDTLPTDAEDSASEEDHNLGTMVIQSSPEPQVSGTSTMVIMSELSRTPPFKGTMVVRADEDDSDDEQNRGSIRMRQAASSTARDNPFASLVIANIAPRNNLLRRPLIFKEPDRRINERMARVTSLHSTLFRHQLLLEAALPKQQAGSDAPASAYGPS
ncbi:hypothetical protein [Legionella sp. CNM-4043-24]|uniref:hypothetical protein n=1 Tax=Legionella sp. CNM-4043-24 TaxID=3421646 RepID=UPI00403B220B